MNKGNRIVSIVIPVYNVEDYLSKCIESVLDQTYTNWELILIDDGSKDKSGEICDSYARKEDRIIVIHKDNSGVSDSRNIGIARSKGDCICFIDADDWIKSKFLEHLMQFSKFDYVIAGYETWPEKSRCILKERKYDRNEMPDLFDEFLQTRPTSCATLFNNGIIKEHHVRFTTQLRNREDHLFNVHYLKWCNSAYVINYQEYIVRSRKVPIAIKFRMHSDDIELVIENLQKGYEDIKNEFGYEIKNLKPTLNLISHYYLEDFLRFNSDDDYYGLYKKYFNQDRKEDMYANTNLSPLNLMIDGIIAYRQVRNMEKMQELVDLFALIFKNVSINKASFRNKHYRDIADAIVNRDFERTKREINKALRLNQMNNYIKNIIRPLFNQLKLIFG